MTMILIGALSVGVARPLGWFVAGFLAATVAAAAFSGSHAHAQEASARAGIRSQGSGGSPLRLKTDPLLETEGSYLTPNRSPDLDPSQAGEAEDLQTSEEVAPEDGSEASEGASPPRLKRLPADGDLSYPEEQSPQNDGIANEADPVPPQDGADAIEDTRPPEDRRVFDEPAAGHDPLLFQIEDIDPVETDRRPERLARLEPYDPIGVTVGSFVFFPEAEVAGFATNNVFSGQNGKSDVAGDVITNARLVSAWSRHALEFKGTTSSRFYDAYGSEDTFGWNVEARGRLDVTRRTNIQGRLQRDVSAESRSGVDANRAGPRADITTDTAALTLNHRFNRLSIQLRGAVSDTTYSSTTAQSNAGRDVVETEEAIRASWEFKPTLSAFGETALVQRDRESSGATDRSSTGERYRVGLDFGAASAVLRGEISIGYGRQEPSSETIEEIGGFLFDANLAYRASELTSFLLTAKTDISDSTSSPSIAVISRQIGLEARHSPRRYLVATAGLVYTDYDYGVSPTEESALTASLGAEYFASREVILFGRYQHTHFASNQPQADFDSDEVRIGMRVRK